MIVQRQALLLQGVFIVSARRVSGASPKPGCHARRAVRQLPPRPQELLNLLFWQQLFSVPAISKGLLDPAAGCRRLKRILAPVLRSPAIGDAPVPIRLRNAPPITFNAWHPCRLR
jgi:hypothetical protein